MDLNALVFRIKCEFMEMPGLRVTMPQAERLWGMERVTCEQVIGKLVASAFLRQTKEGLIVRTGGV